MRDREGESRRWVQRVTGRLATARPTLGHDEKNDPADCPKARCQIDLHVHLHRGLHWIAPVKPRGHGTKPDELITRPCWRGQLLTANGLLASAHWSFAMLLSQSGPRDIRPKAGDHLTFSGLAGRLGGANAQRQYLRSNRPNLCQVGAKKPPGGGLVWALKCPATVAQTL